VTRKPVVKTSDDGMKAYLDPETNMQPLPLNILTELVNDSGVKYGLDKTRLKYISESGFKSGSPVLIAEGVSAVHGCDSEIIICYRQPIYPDTHNQNQATGFPGNRKIAKKNEVLAVKLKPGKGEFGYDVFGEAITPKPGKDIMFEPGKNIQLRYYKDKIEYSAMCEGIVSLEIDSIEVDTLAILENDVDLSMGDIEFSGSLLIRRNVCKGFRVQSNGNVKIEGNVDGGTVIAGGNIIVSGSVIGASKLYAGGRIKLGYIEHSSAEAGQSFAAEEGIIHSDIVCGGKVSVSGSRGIIAGGIIKSAEGVEARVIGTEMATPTVLYIESTFFNDHQLERLGNELRSISTEISKLHESLKPFLNADEGVLSLPAEKKWVFRSLANRLKELKTQRNNVRLKMVRIDRETVKEAVLPQQVKIHRTAFKGVRIHINGKPFNIESELNQVAIFESPVTKNITVTALNN
jgi:uncharacterized protein